MPFRPLNTNSQPQQSSGGFRILADPNGNPINQESSESFPSQQPQSLQSQQDQFSQNHPILGFGRDLIKGAVKPFLEVGASANNVKNAIGSLVKGDVQQAGKDIQQTYNLPFFGDTKPAFTGQESFGEGVKKMAGYGAEIASNFVPVGKAGSVAKNVIKTVGKDVVKKTAGQIAKNTLKTSGQFALAGALGNAGSQLANKDVKDFSGGELAGSAALSGLLPLTLGAGRLAGRGTSNLVKGVKNTIVPDVEAALTKAIKPKANNFGFTQSLKTALPDIQETAQQVGRKIENIDQLDDVIAQAKKRVWANYENLLGPNANATIDGNTIADEIVRGIDKRFSTQNPQKVQRIMETANTYRRPLSLQEAEDFLQSSNNELHSYYAKNKVQQSVAAADPETAHLIRENNALRNNLNKRLEELTGADAAELKKRYGALSTLQSEIVPRKNVIARQNPVNLAEQIGYGRAIGNVAKSALNMQIGDALSGAADIATTKLLKGRNDPNELIKLAFSKLAKKPRTPYAPIKAKPFVPAGLLSAPNYIPMAEKTGSRIQNEIMSSGMLPQPNIQPSPNVFPEAKWLDIQNRFNQSPPQLSPPQQNILQLPAPRALSKVKKNPIGDMKSIPLSQRAAMLKQFLQLK